MRFVLAIVMVLGVVGLIISLMVVVQANQQAVNMCVFQEQINLSTRHEAQQACSNLPTITAQDIGIDLWNK